MYLADLLQNIEDHLQVADMKGRQGQSDMSEMSIALAVILMASVALIPSARDPETLVERPILSRGTIAINVVERSVADLEHGLVQYLLFGKDPKLELPDLFWDLVDHLLLDRLRRRHVHLQHGGWGGQRVDRGYLSRKMRSIGLSKGSRMLSAVSSASQASVRFGDVKAA